MSRRTLVTGTQGSIIRDQRGEQSRQEGARGQGPGQADWFSRKYVVGEERIWHRTWELLVVESLSTTLRTERQQLREKHLT